LAKVVTIGTTVKETMEGRNKYTATERASERKKRIQYIFFALLVMVFFYKSNA